ncbi:MAG: class I SAM-dependent methyltransferase [Methanomassiliicoccales archaeon]
MDIERAFVNPTRTQIALVLLISNLTRRLRYHPFIDELDLKGDEIVLDFGSGWGDNTRYISDSLDKGGRVIALDISSKWQDIIKKRLKGRKNIEYVKSDILTANLPDSSFEVIVIHYVLHEVPIEDRQPSVEELASKLKPGGFIQLREPTKKGHGMPIEEVRSLMNSVDLTESRMIEKRANFQARYTKGR